jgi:hypothetical protein
MFQHAALEKIQFQASAAQIENQPRLHLVAERPVDCLANQTRFFLAADDFEFQAGLPADSLHQAAIVAHLAGCRRGYGAVAGDMMLIHAVSEVPECAGGAGNRFVVKHAVSESVVAQPDGHALIFEDLDVLRRRGPRDH